MKNLVPLLALLLLSCCKKDDANPCENLIPTSASFRMIQTLESRDIDKKKVLIVREVSSIIKDQFVTFESNNNHASYQYKVGSDAREWTSKSFFLSFNQVYKGLAITLIVNDIPNLDCFPSDDGIDTVTQLLDIIDYEEWPLYGDYVGYFDHDPKNSIKITLIEDGIIGILGQNDPACHPNDTLVNYDSKTIFGCTFSTTSCVSPSGFATIEGEKITLVYHERLVNGLDRVNRVFTGTKVN